MTEKVLKVFVQNIQELYPQQSILSKSLLVKTVDMTMVQPPEASKIKQTARKTAKSKPFSFKDVLSNDTKMCTISNPNIDAGTKTQTENDKITEKDKQNIVTEESVISETTKDSAAKQDSEENENCTKTDNNPTICVNKETEKDITQDYENVKLQTTPNNLPEPDEKTNLPNNDNNSVQERKPFTAIVLPRPNKVENKPKKSVSIESVIQNLNMKQHKALLSAEITEPKATLKRSSSPVETCAAKKLKQSDNNVLNGITNHMKPINGLKSVATCAKPQNVDVFTQTFHRCTCDFEKFKDLLKKENLAFLQKEIIYKEQLKLKNKECAKLKEKCENVEKNFKRWIEFANKLQARVKKVAQQYETLKRSALKEYEKSTASVQTDPWPTVQKEVPKKENLTETTPPAQSNQSIAKVASQNETRQQTPEAPNTKPKLTKPNVTPSDVIDLTSDTDVTPAKKKNNTSVQEALQRILATPQTSMKPPPNQAKLVPTFQPGNRSNMNMSEHKHVGGVPQATPQSAIFSSDSRLRMQNPVAPHTVQRPQQSPHIYSNPQARHPTSQLHAKPKPTPAIAPTPYPPLPQVASASLPSKPIPKNAPSGLPPELILGIKKSKGVIILSWRNQDPNATGHASVASYELFAHQEAQGHASKEWRKIGSESIAAMPLPMACTLTQFTSGCTYYFTVRGKDVFGRYGHFSKPCSSADVKE
uniref:Activating transcription factor 7-interacting protein 1-like n=1 Tax=Phallusia mammillata TaxID=59560 RepID=A0A6F9D7N4_9ASCI|nr:activating transcription factor 7-interacting protein 1-like [Phallusia mammillata]